MKQNKKQTVYFLYINRWYKKEVEMESLYREVHSASSEYGITADLLLKEMLANMLDLARMGRIDLSKPLVITDYGCGRSTASNKVAQIIAETGDIMMNMLNNGYEYGAILMYLEPNIKNTASVKVTELDQIMRYSHVTVQRYDIGVDEFSKPLEKKADVVFCNDVFEHIPYNDISAFVQDLENAGKYVLASISLRDAVNYSKLSKEVLLDGAVSVEADDIPETAITLREDSFGSYIFSLHVTVMPQDKWQEVLGSSWRLLPAQDYTAVSASNFEPSQEYQDFKRDLIANIGFADFIPFPTESGSAYEKNPVLFKRTAMMQPIKHVYKLNALENYPESEFKTAEKQQSEAFLKFVGAEVEKNPRTGLWEIVRISGNNLKRLYALEYLSKAGGGKDADDIIADYNSGNTSEVDSYGLSN